MVRVYGEDYRRIHNPSAAQETVLRHISTCRTAALGGHLEECDSCAYRRIAYNSCRDRHCPKCQSRAQVEWITGRLERLLPVPYFHVVFTIPDGLNPLALRNQKTVYDILFAAASQTLKAIAQDDKHLGAQLGFTMVLHTWGQNLLFHPHVHCVVTGGGLSPDRTRWIASRESYLFPVKVLGRLFRGKFLAMLDRAYQDSELEFAGSTAELASPEEWSRFKDGLYKKDWVVYAKPPFGGPEQVFNYLGRYTHRIAISNHRIIDISDGKVSFSWKDYSDSSKKKVLRLDAVEFLRRFLLHVLPKGFVRLRHYGLYASSNVNTKLATARHLLMLPSEPSMPSTSAPETAEPSSTSQPETAEPFSTSQPETAEPLPWWERFREQTGVDLLSCPSCTAGRMQRQRRLSPVEAALFAERLTAPKVDTS